MISSNLLKSLRETPPTIVGRGIQLEPLLERHAEGLAKISTKETFKFFLSDVAPDLTAEQFRAYIQGLDRVVDQVSFAVIDAETRSVVGSTSYLDIRPQDAHVEIGITWYAESVRGGYVNPATKLAMLTYAFEELAAERVSLKTDARNLHSQAAILKLGAKHEGVLRRHRQLSNGFFRDTVYFSILREEWSLVKSGLEARLSRFPECNVK